MKRFLAAASPSPIQRPRISSGDEESPIGGQDTGRAPEDRDNWIIEIT
jgi:hypothetical protein